MIEVENLPKTTLLSPDQIIGSNALDVILKYGKQTEISDFAAASGGKRNKLIVNNTVGFG